MRKLLNNFIFNKKVRDIISGGISIILIIISILVHDFNIAIYGSIINVLGFFIINRACRSYVQNKLEEIGSIDYNSIEDNGDSDIK